MRFELTRIGGLVAARYWVTANNDFTKQSFDTTAGLFDAEYRPKNGYLELPLYYQGGLVATIHWNGSVDRPWYLSGVEADRKWVSGSAVWSVN